MVERLIEAASYLQELKMWRKGVDGLIECSAKTSNSQTVRKSVNCLVEITYEFYGVIRCSR